MAAEMLAVGVGCTRGAPCEVLAAGIDAVLAQHGLERSSVRALASIEHKHDEVGLLTLAAERGWPLTFYAAEALAAAACVPSSARVMEAVGTPSVAEPAALLRAASRTLLVPKTIHRDAESGHRVTVAIARLTTGGA